MTQREAADRAGISVRALRDIEQGRVLKPHARSVRALTGLLREPRADVRVDVLGPLAVRRGADTVDVGPAMRRRLLGLLALRAGEAVPREEIVDVLWQERIPATYANLVHTHVARLRRLIGPELVRRAGSGYRLALRAEQCDLLEFRAAVEAGEHQRALALWRGPVLADAGSALAQHPAAVAAGRARITAVLALADRCAAEGRPQAALPALWSAAEAEPLHEGLNARIMLALAGSGQRAAALRVFGEMSARLADALGIAPGPELTDAHLRVLREEPSAAPPAQLPPDVVAFTGRADELALLDAHVGAPRVRPAVAVVSGPGGMGKSALAAHWAHRARHLFPDGQLHVDLRGHSDRPPRTAGDALTELLHALGVSPASVPADHDARAALLRSRLAERRVLLVVDDAISAEQVRPLIPAGPGCAVVITTRADLSALRVHDDALVLRLAALPEPESVRLLAALLGPVAGVATLDELARLCGRLPLALRIAAANVTLGAYDSVADYTRALRDGNRLHALSVGGDSTATVRAAFRLSYDALAPADARAFRLLSAAPGADFGLDSAAALLDLPAGDTARGLARLVGAHLLERRPGDRFHFHDLLRLFAAERAAEEDRREVRDAAWDRLLGHYLRAAHTATSRRFPTMLRICDAPAYPGPGPELPADWLETELGNLVAAAHHAAAHGPRAGAWVLTDILRAFLLRVYGVEALACLAATGLAAAEAEGDRLAIAAMRYSAGATTLLRPCELDVGEQHLAAAQRIFREQGATHGRAAALDVLGGIQLRAGRRDEALATLTAAYELCRRERFTVGQARVRCSLGLATAGTPESFAHLADALALAGLLRDQHIEAIALHNRAVAHRRRGDRVSAERDYRAALALRVGIDDAEGTGATLAELGDLLADEDPAAARAHWRRARAVLEGIGHPMAEQLRARLA